MAATINYLFSTLLMGLSLLVIGWTLTQMRAWRQYTPGASGFGAGAGRESRLAAFVRSPAAWMLGFVLLALVFGGGALAFIGGLSLPEGVSQAAGLSMAAAAVVLLVSFLVVGVYRAAKDRGIPSSQAAAMGAWVFGLVVLTVVTVRLVTTSG